MAGIANKVRDDGEDLLGPFLVVGMGGQITGFGVIEPAGRVGNQSMASRHAEEIFATQGFGILGRAIMPDPALDEFPAELESKLEVLNDTGTQTFAHDLIQGFHEGFIPDPLQ